MALAREHGCFVDVLDPSVAITRNDFASAPAPEGGAPGAPVPARLRFHAAGLAGRPGGAPAPPVGVRFMHLLRANGTADGARAAPRHPAEETIAAGDGWTPPPPPSY